MTKQARPSEGRAPRTREGLWCLSCYLSGAQWRRIRSREFEQEQHAGQQDQQTHQVRRRENASQVSYRVITAKSLNKGTQHGVADQVGGEDLAVEAFVAVKPGQRDIEGQVEERVIDLGRMNGEPVGFMV